MSNNRLESWGPLKSPSGRDEDEGGFWVVCLPVH